MRRGDLIHLGLMCGALAVAYLVPFELLLLSYVVLGPAHYCTEISWLHDRKYFLPHRALPIGLALVAIGAAFITDGVWFGIVIWGALVLSALFAATTSAQSTIISLLAVALTLVIAVGGSSFVMIGTLVPTLVHVSLFTLVFMIVGARKSGAGAHIVLIVAYLMALAAILIVPPSALSLVPAFAAAAKDYFGGVAPALGRLFGIHDLRLDARITGLLAFVYTYHYLNWFIKADVIGWFNVPRPRMALAAAASLGATALYFYDYALGFTVLLGLSLLHVVLEFPLNAISLQQLVEFRPAGVKRKLRPRPLR